MKIGLFAVVAALALGACASARDVPEGEFRIEGRVRHVPDGAILSLVIDKPTGYVVVQADTLRRGKFVFQDTATVLRQLMITAEGEGFPNTWLPVWVDSGKRIRVNGQDKLLDLWRVESNIAEQQESNAYTAYALEERRKLSECAVEQVALLKQMGGMYASDTKEKRQLAERFDSVTHEVTVLTTAMALKELEYMQTAPKTPLWWERLLMYAKTARMMARDTVFVNQVRAVYARLTKEEREAGDGADIAYYLLPKKIVGVGDAMADGDLYDREGKVHHLSELEGGYILLDFYGSGCLPCRQALPELEKLMEMYKGKLHVVGISRESKESWIEYLDKVKPAGLQWNEADAGREGLFRAYGVQPIPHYVLISPERKVVDSWVGYGEGRLKMKVRRWLEE